MDGSAKVFSSWKEPTIERRRSDHLLSTGGARAEMKIVPEILQHPVEIERRRPLPLEPEPLEELDLLRGRTAAQGCVTKELLEPRLFRGGLVGVSFHELEFLGVARSQPAAQHDLHAEGGEVDVPGFYERIQQGNAVPGGQVEDVRVQELEDHDSHVFVASMAETGDQVEPVFTL